MTSIKSIMEPHRHHLSALSNDDLLAHLAGLEPLPDEAEPTWFDEGSPLWDRAGEFLVLADEVAARRLRPGIRLVLEKACFGDPFETMRGLRHSLEHAVDRDWPALTAICISSMSSTRPGTRLWAMNELASLRDPDALPSMLTGLQDPEALIRAEACRAIEMFSQQHPDDALTATDDLRVRRRIRRRSERA